MIKRKAFTLLEILLVIAAIGILAAIVIVAINPQRQLASARNVQRLSDMFQIGSAVSQFNIDNNGEDLVGLEEMGVGEIRGICAAGVVEVDCQNEGLVYAGNLVPDYISSLPQDPQASGNESGYLVYKSSADNYGIVSEHSENNDVKSIGTIPEGLKSVPEGLIHYFDFEESAFDKSKGTANMSWNGTEQYVTSGIGNTDFINQYSAQIDFISYLSSGSPSLNGIVGGDFSIFGWFKTGQVVSGDEIGLWGQNNVLEVCIWADNTIGFWLNETGEYIQLDSSDVGGINDDSWHHLGLVYQSGTPTIYYDGIDVTSLITYSDFGDYTSTSPDPINIGGAVCDSAGDNFDGEIDEVRIYDRGLSPEEVQQISSN